LVQHSIANLYVRANMSRPVLADPAGLSATEAAEAIRERRLSSQALVRACLDRIAEREPDVQAWAHLDPDYALAQARARDEELKSGRGVGPLHGVPIGVKDIFDTADFPTEHGSPIFAGRRPERDAACVARLREAGAVILGKTVTTELALLTPARTRNPHKSTHAPGGSSAGSAAAVAAGMVPAAVGGQTAGSVIRPASFCGVYGYKPTLGLVPRGGVLMQSHTLDTVGVLGRSVDDLALLTDCMAAFEPGDSVSYGGSRPGLLEVARQEPPAPPLFAFVKTPAWADADPVLHAAFAELMEELGPRAVEVEIPSLADAIAAQRLVQLAENAHYYEPLLRTSPELLSPGLKERLEAGMKVDVQDYIRALAGCEGTYRVVAGVLDDYGAILTPAAPGPAPQGFASTGSPVFNGMWTYLGMPCVTLPLLEAGGLPIGVQLVGKRRDDGRLLRSARALVSALARAD
jgi:Asp-tRNA(Asn)/Glu-tRNA(Gln) amidotransferase A subunit family amidase